MVTRLQRAYRHLDIDRERKREREILSGLLHKIGVPGLVISVAISVTTGK